MKNKITKNRNLLGKQYSYHESYGKVKYKGEFALEKRRNTMRNCHGNLPLLLHGVFDL